MSSFTLSRDEAQLAVVALEDKIASVNSFMRYCEKKLPEELAHGRHANFRLIEDQLAKATTDLVGYTAAVEAIRKAL